jgi:predicted transcriptional regulator
MQPSVLETAKDLVKAQIEAGELTPDDMQKVLHDTHARLMALQARSDPALSGEVAGTGSPSGSIDWRKSITRHVITCLECGASFKQLSIRHLRHHDLDARSYRSKYGIPRTQSLAARDTTARRRQVVQASRPWEKTRRYLSAQSKQSVTSKRKAPVKKKRANRR